MRRIQLSIKVYGYQHINSSRFKKPTRTEGEKKLVEIIAIIKCTYTQKHTTHLRSLQEQKENKS